MDRKYEKRAKNGLKWHKNDIFSFEYSGVTVIDMKNLIGFSKSPGNVLAG